MRANVRVKADVRVNADVRVRITVSRKGIEVSVRTTNAWLVYMSSAILIQWHGWLDPMARLA